MTIDSIRRDQDPCVCSLVQGGICPLYAYIAMTSRRVVPCSHAATLLPAPRVITASSQMRSNDKRIFRSLVALVWSVCFYVVIGTWGAKRLLFMSTMCYSYQTRSKRAPGPAFGVWCPILLSRRIRNAPDLNPVHK